MHKQRTEQAPQQLFRVALGRLLAEAAQIKEPATNAVRITISSCRTVRKKLDRQRSVCGKSQCVVIVSTTPCNTLLHRICQDTS
jgi:hypothetical protein